jgi:virulence factor Mce-like protein
MRDRTKNLLVVVATTLVGVGFFGWLLIYTDQVPGTDKGYEVKAVLPTSASLATGARVTMAGYQVGRVTKIERRGVGGLVTMKLSDERVTPVPADTRIALRQRTPLGENYVSLTPGRSRSELPDGGMIPLTRSDEYVEVDQVLSVLQGDTRRRAQKLIQGAGGALDANGLRLRQLLAGTSGVITNTAKVVDVVDRRRTQIPALVEQLGQITAAVGERGAAIRQIGRAGLQTFEAVGDEDAALRAAVRELPSTLRSARSLTSVLGSVSDRATPTVAALAAVVADLRPTVRTLTPAANGGVRLTGALGDAAPKLETLLRAARPLADRASSTLPKVQDVLCQAAPAVEYLRPYIDDITQGLANLGSSANAYDALGHLVRLQPVLSDNSLVAMPDSVSKAAYKLIHTGLLSKLTSISYNPFPKPGQIGKEVAPDTGQILGPKEYASVYTYPRIKKAC